MRLDWIKFSIPEITFLSPNKKRRTVFQNIEKILIEMGLNCFENPLRTTTVNIKQMYLCSLNVKKDGNLKIHMRRGDLRGCKGVKYSSCHGPLINHTYMINEYGT